MPDIAMLPPTPVTLLKVRGVDCCSQWRCWVWNQLSLPSEPVCFPRVFMPPLEHLTFLKTGSFGSHDNPGGSYSCFPFTQFAAENHPDGVPGPTPVFLLPGQAWFPGRSSFQKQLGSGPSCICQGKGHPRLCYLLS